MDRYNRIQARVGNTDVDDASANIVMPVNEACDTPKSFGLDGYFIFYHVCDPAITGKYVTLQLTDDSVWPSFDVTELEVFTAAKVKGGLLKLAKHVTQKLKSHFNLLQSYFSWPTTRSREYPAVGCIEFLFTKSTPSTGSMKPCTTAMTKNAGGFRYLQTKYKS